MPPDPGLRESGGFRQAYRLVRPFFRRYRRRLAGGFLCLLVVDFMQLVIPRLIKRAVDVLESAAASPHLLFRYGLLITGLAVGIGLFRFGWRYLLLGFSRLVERDLRNRLFRHLLELDRLFFNRRPPGTLMALSSNDLNAVQMACGMGLVAFIDALVMTSAALCFMAYIHPRLTMIALMPMPVLVLLTRRLSARLHQRFRRVQEQFSVLTEFARSTFGAMHLIKAYTQEKSQLARFDRLGRRYIRQNLQLAVVQGTLFPVSGLVANTSILLVLFFGGRLTVRGEISIGDFAAFISYLYMLTWPMMALGWVTNLFQRGATSLGRINDVLDERPVLAGGGGSRPAGIRPEYSVRGLRFAYPGRRVPALDGITLDIGPGILGIVGRTGSGKSTLCQLLARVYPAPADTIFLGGYEINSLDPAAVREQIAYVSQDMVLFSDTVRANLVMGRPEAAAEDIEAAARAARLHEEILALPRGYDTRIGERGVKLSGGQRQRLALARALLADRRILIIDDGLSAVDMETEQRIIASLAAHTAGRTCIIVSHRLAPLSAAAEIAVLERGRLAAFGPHARLLRDSRYYRLMYEYQQTLDGGSGG